MLAARLAAGLTLLLAAAGCGADDPVKFVAGYEGAGLVSFQLDSSGEVELKALKTYAVSLGLFDLGEGVKTAEDRIEEEAERRTWYVIFRTGQQEAVYQFDPQDFLRVELDGQVVQELRQRESVVDLKPGATVKVIAVSRVTSGRAGPLTVRIPGGFVGSWNGHLVHINRPYSYDNKTPITVSIPGTAITKGREIRMTIGGRRSDLDVHEPDGVLSGDQIRAGDWRLTLSTEGSLMVEQYPPDDDKPPFADYNEPDRVSLLRRTG